MTQVIRTIYFLPMKFEHWFNELISDERWHEFAGKNHKPETFQKVAEQVYTLGISDSHNFEIVPLREHRNHVVNKLNKILPDKPKVDWIAKALKKKEEESQVDWKPASPEHVDKCVAEFDAMMKSSSMLNAFPRIGYKQAVEEGGWLPKKDAPYPITSPDEAYIKMRHLEYVKQNYEPRTGAKLPQWVSEDEFNYQFDEGLI